MLYTSHQECSLTRCKCELLFNRLGRCLDKVTKKNADYDNCTIVYGIDGIPPVCE